MAERILKPTLVLTDDDPDFRLVAEDAIKVGCTCDIRCLENGRDLLRYLRREEPYTNVQEAPRPSLIVIDLHMPHKGGVEAVKEIKSDPALRQIPIVVMTTSQDEKEIYSSYDLGAASFIVKPRGFTNLVDVFRDLCRYWFEIARLPPEKSTPAPAAS